MVFNRLKAEFEVDHPSIWFFISKLKEVQQKQDGMYERCIAGHAPAHKRNRYLQADERILSRVLNFEHYEIVEYLRGIAHNILE